MASFPKLVQVVRPKIDVRGILTREANCNAAAPKNEIEAALASQMACTHAAATAAGLAAQTNFVGGSGNSLTAEGVKDFFEITTQPLAKQYAALLAQAIVHTVRDPLIRRAFPGN